MAKAPVVPIKPKKSAAARQTSVAKQVAIVLGSGTLMAAAIGTYLVVTYVGTAKPAMPSVASAMPADHSGAIIVRATGGTGCRRMKFDNASGSITDDGPAPCEQDTPPSAAAEPAAASGGSGSERFGLIANGFQHR